ncbi:hypothetical protein QIW53_06255 [Pseudomonas fluorescens]|uniref:hypothetical protein n=1 Tax=Pseudomonas fluorescens TaxID=294 RepID=UPI0035236867
MKYLLQGKKILFVAPRFFGYESEICDELIRRGASVDFLLDRPFDTPAMKAMTRLNRNMVIKAADKYYFTKLNDLGSDFYDYVFVVNGQTLSNQTLAKWRAKFVDAIFILYMWDSFGNRKSAVDSLKYFDHVFTFDKEDASKYSLNFRPLFFSNGFENVQSARICWDISFVGTAHTDRAAVVQRVSRVLQVGVRKYFFLYLQAKWVFWLYRFTNSSFLNSKLSDFSFHSIDKKTVQSVFNSSVCILDIEHPKQTGLTMRTLETLGACKKLITTNKNVVDYDFFDERNICVIDRLDPKIPADFLTQPYYPVPSNIYHRYRLAGWMDEIIGASQS